MEKRQNPGVPAEFIGLIRKRMEELGLNLNQLAKQAAISQSYLYQVLDNKRGLPSDGHLGQLAKALKIETNQLLLAAGRVPASMNVLFRSFGQMSETERKAAVKACEQIVRRHRRRKETASK